MTRREYLGNWPCGQDGCRERARFVYDLKRDYQDAYKRYAAEPWRCTRHSRPAEVLSTENVRRELVLTASRVPYSGYERMVADYERYQANATGYAGLYRGPRKPTEEDRWLKGLFWIGEGESSGSGFTFGPGFKAFATDFPEGTQLRITAEVVIPDA